MDKVELKQKITDICFEKGAVSKPMVDDLCHLIDEWVAGVIPEKFNEITADDMPLSKAKREGYNAAIDEISRRAGIGDGDG